MAIMVGTGRGARAGVLIKNAEALEVLEKVDTLVVDKTGTLTEGKPTLTTIVAVGSVEEPTLVRLVASLERGSEHPLASALIRAAEEQKLTMSEARDFHYVPGKGVSGIVDGKAVLVGTERLLSDSGITTSELESRAESLRNEGQTTIFVAIDGKLAGILGVADPVKAGAPEAIRELKSQGMNILMLTGDNRATAQAVARKLGIEEVEAEVLPERKSEVIASLQQKGRIVAMAGDGINDAPALAQAHVGIAMSITLTVSLLPLVT